MEVLREGKKVTDSLRAAAAEFTLPKYVSLVQNTKKTLKVRADKAGIRWASDKPRVALSTPRLDALSLTFTHPLLSLNIPSLLSSTRSRHPLRPNRSTLSTLHRVW